MSRFGEVSFATTARRLRVVLLSAFAFFFSVCRRLLLRCGERLWRCSGLDTLKDSSMFHNNGSVVDVSVVFQRQVLMIPRMSHLRSSAGVVASTRVLTLEKNALENCTFTLQRERRVKR